jgi:hypothetical protein
LIRRAIFLPKKIVEKNFANKLTVVLQTVLELYYANRGGFGKETKWKTTRTHSHTANVRFVLMRWNEQATKHRWQSVSGREQNEQHEQHLHNGNGHQRT